MKPLILSAVLAVLVLSAAHGQDNALSELLGETLVDASGKEVPVDSLKGKLIGVYFSAMWCPPCRAFTPELVKFRDHKDDEFEVVFVSSDKSQEDKQKYMTDYRMKWLTIPMDSPKVSGLRRRFSVTGIPRLVVIDDKGNVISEQARNEVSENPNKALREWKKAAGQES